jgi:hypothetical protein
MKELYEEWFPLGDDLPFLDYVAIEIIYAGTMNFFFKKNYKSNSSIVNSSDRVVVEFELQPVSYRVGDESYRQRTLSALPEGSKGSFFLSKQSIFLSDFYDDAGEVYKNADFEHLLIVTPNSMFDFILDERPKISIVHQPAAYI